LLYVVAFRNHDKRVPVTTVRRILRLRMEERPPIWRGAANVLNTLAGGLGKVLTTAHCEKWLCYTTWTRASELDWYFGAS